MSPTRVDLRKKIGPAWALHELLIDQQTDADGRVNYGKPFGYAWLRSRIADPPPLRTLKRHMARLKALGLVWVHVIPYGGGMRVRLLGSVKWKPEAPAAVQMALFPPVGIVSISSGKASENLLKVESLMGPKVAPYGGQKWPRNDSKNQPEEKSYGNTGSSLRSSPVENAAALEARRRLLRDQAAMLMAKVKNSG